MWADGVAKFGEDGDAFETNPFNANGAEGLLGLDVPTFSLDTETAGHGLDATYAQITPDGKLTLTEAGKAWMGGREGVTLRVKINAKSRFGSIEGYNANDVIVVNVKI